MMSAGLRETHVFTHARQAHDYVTLTRGYSSEPGEVVEYRDARDPRRRASVGPLSDQWAAYFWRE